jgi:hypothetical protein
LILILGDTSQNLGFEVAAMASRARTWHKLGVRTDRMSEG